MFHILERLTEKHERYREAKMRAIIINRMYAGAYLAKGIGGGEVINLLYADNGKNYCFINPYGMISPAYDDKVCAVVHTRLHEAGCFEVLGVGIFGPDSQLTHQKGASAEERALNCANALKEYIKKNPILYGGVPYVSESDKWPGITFAAERLLFPKKQVFILDSVYPKEISNSIVSYKLWDKRFSKQSLHMYVDDIKCPLSFNQIMKMIENEDLWEERVTKIDSVQYSNRFNFLSLIGKEDDELAFSNLFSYFFSNYRNLFVDFARDVLKIEIGEPYEIEREFHNIDLWIEDDNNVVVIENKVKSGINGVSPRHDFSDGGLVQSQLLKYYRFAKTYAATRKNKKVSCFLFVPNYNHLDLSVYEGSRFYKEIRYREIYRYLISKSIDNPYYQDFCNALYKHAKDITVDYSEILLNYLLKQIKKELAKASPKN